MIPIIYAAGCLGQGGHSNHLDNPQQRDHSQPPDLSVPARGEQVVPSPQQRSGEHLNTS